MKKKKRVFWKFFWGVMLMASAGGDTEYPGWAVFCFFAGLGLLAWGIIGLFRTQRKAATAPASTTASSDKETAATGDPLEVKYPFTRIDDLIAVRLKDYVVIDTETTGFSPRDDKIIEVGCYKIKDGTVSRYHSLVNPGRRIPKRSVDVHHITDADVADAPTFPQILPDLDVFLEDLPVVGQSVNFDLRMLWWAYHDAGADMPAKRYVDTARLAKKVWPGRDSYSLATMILDYNLIEGEQTHRSESDVDATLALYRLCCEELTKIKPKRR